MGAFGAAAAAALILLPFASLQQAVYSAQASEQEKKECNLYNGKWEYDESYPIYNSTQCPFIEQEFDCQNNGRPDQSYLKFKWHPNSCKLPRFNGRHFLRRLRGKRLMFVGDSLSLNQWQSLTCMLHVAVPRAKYTLKRSGGVSTFTFPAYDVSLLFSRTAFLVDIVGEKDGRVLKVNSIESGQTWQGMDTLIFDSWHWWRHTGKKQPWDMIGDEGKTYKDMDRYVAFEKALNTWASWVDSNIDPNKTKVYFQGVSPDHSNASDWTNTKGRSCKGETEPILESEYPGKKHPAEAIVEKIIGKMSKTTVHLLDITELSQLRKDGHRSLYGYAGHTGNDCSYWCLPGVPDAWNQLLYASLIFHT